MKTTVASPSATVTIDTEGPLTIIGEKINPTGRGRLQTALREGDYDYVASLAVAQVAAGADILDINVGVPGTDEVATIKEVITIVSDAVGVPLCIDSPSPQALAAALETCEGRPLVNSVTGEEASMKAILPLIRHYDVPVIGLLLDEGGIPGDESARLDVARKLIARARSLGIPTENIVIDPLVLSVGSDDNAALVALDTMKLVAEEFGVNINVGASNVSFGLPDRHTVNQAFLGLAAGAGASSAITDPARTAPIIRAADLLRGRDPHAMRYIRNYRAHATGNR